MAQETTDTAAILVPTSGLAAVVADADGRLNATERDALREQVVALRAHVVAARLRIGRATILRALAGLPLRRGSLVLIRQALATWEASP